jgi:metal-responsive CopG/Arc/MetJ family transcriptional regulator
MATRIQVSIPDDMMEALDKLGIVVQRVTGRPTTRQQMIRRFAEEGFRSYVEKMAGERLPGERTGATSSASGNGESDE